LVKCDISIPHSFLDIDELYTNEFTTNILVHGFLSLHVSLKKRRYYGQTIYKTFGSWVVQYFSKDGSAEIQEYITNILVQ
jgi:hypothetical protein